MTEAQIHKDSDPITPEAAPRNVTLRLMTIDEMPLMVGWLNQPHVAEWFHDHPTTLEAVTEKYKPRIDGTSPTKVFTAVAGGKPIGMIQAYQVHNYPEYAEAIGMDEAIGIDLFIGEADYLGKGYGRDIIDAFVRDAVGEHFEDAQLVVASPSVNNLGSINAFEVAGFSKGSIVDVPGEQTQEQVMTRSIVA